MTDLLIMTATAFLTVTKVDLGTAPEMERVDSLMEAGGLELHEVGRVNWPEKFPDKPDVRFRIAHSGDEIYLKFYVKEDAARAVYDRDGEKPWQESCVEFFLATGEEGDDTYYNLEMSCIGYGILHGGKPGARTEVAGGIGKVRRMASMERKPFGVEEGAHVWTLTLAIPTEVYSMETARTLSGRTLRANFYKCGDLLPRPHYLSWSPVDTPEPSFHQPGFFGELFFE